MRKLFATIISTALATASLWGADHAATASALAGRVVPTIASDIVFELLHIWLHNAILEVARMGAIHRLDGSKRGEYALGNDRRRKVVV